MMGDLCSCSAGLTPEADEADKYPTGTLPSCGLWDHQPLTFRMQCARKSKKNLPGSNCFPPVLLRMRCVKSLLGADDSNAACPSDRC